MKTREIFQMRFVVLLFVSLFAWACNKQNNKPEAFTISAIYDLSGPQSSLDLPSSQGAQLAIQEINRAGGVGGKAVQLILRDGETDTNVLRADVADVLREHPETAAFLGLSDTDQALAAAGVAADQHRVFLTSGATSPQLPNQIPDYLFLACFGDNVQAAAAAEWAYHDLGARTAAIAYDSTQTYTSLLQGYFLSRFEQLGGQIISVKAYNEQDLSSIADGIQGADLFFLAAMPQNVPDGIQKARSSGFTGPVIGGDSFDSEDIWQGNNAIQNVFFTTHAYLGSDNPDLRIKTFREAYRIAYQGQEPTAFAALGYDAVNLLIKARQIAGNNDPEAVRNALASIRNFEGVTGTISFEEGSRIPKKSVTIMKVEGGTAVLEKVVTPEKVPLP